MIVGDVSNVGAFERDLEMLERDSVIERTVNGFDFHVVDSQTLPQQHTIGGLAVYGTDTIELNLLIGSDIDPSVRTRIAELCVEMVSLRGNSGIPTAFLLCEAGQKILPSLDPDLRKQVGDTIYKNLMSFRRWVSEMDRNNEYMRVNPRARQQLRHSLGWVALERGVSDNGREHIDDLLNRGLNVPNLSSQEVLTARGRNRLHGVNITVYSAQEKGLHHKCKACSGEIHRGTTRITASYDVKIGNSNHHHYHPVCYAETDIKQLDMKTAKIIKSEWQT